MSKDNEGLEEIMGESIYPSTSMLVYRVEFNRIRKPDENISPRDVDGMSVLDLFEKFCTESTELKQVGVESFFFVRSQFRPDDTCLLCQMNSGGISSDTKVLKIEDGEEAYSYGPDKTGLSEHRFLIYHRPPMKYALFCIERVKGAAGDTVALRSFRQYVRRLLPRVNVAYRGEVEHLAVNQFRGIDSIKVIRTVRRADAAEGYAAEPGKLEYRWVHERKSRMPIAKLQEMRDNRSLIYDVLHVPCDFDGEEKVTVSTTSMSGRKVTFILGEDACMPIRETLNEAGEPRLDDRTFVARALDACERIVAATGVRAIGLS